MKKQPLTILIRIVIAAMIILMGMVAYQWHSLPSGEVLVSIPPGSTAVDAARLLYESHVIMYPALFVKAVRVLRLSSRLKAGTYEFSPRGSTMPGVLRAVVSGKTKRIKVTIPEGFTTMQIAQRLQENNIIDAAEFSAYISSRALEGYLLPDTYFFEFNSTPASAARHMETAFQRFMTPERQAAVASLKNMNLAKVVTLASIVEKEAAVAHERAIIAGVFYNRLKKRMPLESCATVLYALGKHKNRLLYKDLSVQSPYNTYLHFGLPPGPICNPGRASLEAVLYPAQTDALYFVVTGSGTHSFSRSLSEHARQKNRLKQIRRANQLNQQK